MHPQDRLLNDAAQEAAWRNRYRSLSSAVRKGTGCCRSCRRGLTPSSPDIRQQTTAWERSWRRLWASGISCFFLPRLLPLWFCFAAVAGTRRRPTAKWVVVCAFTARAAWSGCRDIHCLSRSTRTKCTGSRSRAGERHPVRMDIRVRTRSTRTNRNGLRQPCAHAHRSAHRDIHVRVRSIRNVCTWFPSFAPLAVVSRTDNMFTPPFTPILARRGKIFHLATQKNPPRGFLPGIAGCHETIPSVVVG